MGIWSSFSGTVDVELKSADPSQLLSKFIDQGICISNVRYIDTITTRFSVARSVYRDVRELAKKQGAQVCLLSRLGVYWQVKGLGKRPVLVLGMAFLMAMVLYLPTRVLFVEVTGNTRLPSQMLVEKAAQCGICFGASRAEVRSEKMKNALLSSVPELQWAGINTKGCVAVISVHERSDLEKIDKASGLNSIVATHDGVITELTVLKGNPLCRVGQAVKKGQVLVSAYSDYGTVIKATGADAEVIAQTSRQLALLTPTNYSVREEVISEKNRYSLLIGKKLINLSKDSGISPGECVRIYSQRYVVLPGGFRLPVAIVKEHCTYYETALEQSDDPEDFDWQERSARKYLESQMLAGEVLYSNADTELTQNLCKFYGTYRCREMIGRIRREEIIQGNEQRN